MIRFSVKKLANIAGVSVRTLHYYDQIGLLQPSIRTEARYRFYGEQELLRLQQILFYRELDIPLNQIGDILDDPAFNIIKALENHHMALIKRRDRINTLLTTINKTIRNLKNECMLTPEELYEGLPKEKAEVYRKEAKAKWGSAVDQSENYLRKLGKKDFDKLKEDFASNWKKLTGMVQKDPTSQEVQDEIAQHYAIIRQFWGTVRNPDKQAKAYKGLGELYVADERYTEVDGKSNPAFAKFMKEAMAYFADNNLK